MKQIELVIQNKTGLHARPAKVLVNLAKQFKSNISLHHGGKRANAKSMVSVLTLGAVNGSDITVQANGDDEEKAIAEIEAAILSGLGDNDPPVETVPVSVKVEAPAKNPQTIETVEPGVIKGVGAAPGIAVGPIFHFQQVEYDLDNDDTLSSDNQLNLTEALTLAKAQLAELHQQMNDKKMGAEAAIFEAHMELLDDPELIGAVQERVEAGQSPLKRGKPLLTNVPRTLPR